uniref:thiol oxidase n=1 Tax=viral metagenome TaxID=1070528 RepID=A0A6C0CU72_9ZZZZ
MTKLWGPLGWMTLHSVSLIYPDAPTPEERAIAAKFIDLFGKTITCIFCKNHFASMYALYRAAHPEYLNSKQDFALFVFRAHNTVNKRLDKPRISTVSDCLKTLENNTVNTSFSQFRMSYLLYLSRIWGQDFSGEGRMLQRDVRELFQINSDYWTPRELTSIPELAEADIITSVDRFDAVASFTGNVVPVKVGFAGGRLKLGRR